jgi:hypothetical protein
MIDDLDRSVRTLLTREMGIDNLKVSFATPDAQFRPRVEPPALNLFLYDIRENTDLRQNVWSIQRAGDQVARQAPPVRVDCSYLVTAWVGGEADGNQAEAEHALLGEAMLVLLAHSTLPTDVLAGDLAGQEPPLPSAALHPGRLQSLGEFWQALGGNPKAAFDYTVTIGLQPFARREDRRVDTIKIDVKEKPQPALSGGSAGPGIKRVRRGQP